MPRAKEPPPPARPVKEPLKPSRYQPPPATAPLGAIVLSFGLFEVRRGAEHLAALPLRDAFKGARIAMGLPDMPETMRGWEDKISESRWHRLDMTDRTNLILDYLHKFYQTRRGGTHGR